MCLFVRKCQHGKCTAVRRKSETRTKKSCFSDLKCLPDIPVTLPERPFAEMLLCCPTGGTEFGALLLCQTPLPTSFLQIHTHTQTQTSGIRANTLPSHLHKWDAWPSIHTLCFPFFTSFIFYRTSCWWGRSWCRSLITASSRPRRVGCSRSSWAPSPWWESPCTWVLPSAWGWCSSQMLTAPRWSTTSGCTAWTTRRTSSR